VKKDIDVSVKRLLKARFELGEMDDPDKVEWTKFLIQWFARQNMIPCH
jgi:hypothetical protein